LKKNIALMLLIILCAAFAVAQDAPKAEVFGGYQFISLDTKNIGIDRQMLHGWDADVAFNPTKNLGIVADISGVYKSEIQGVQVDGKLYNYLFGPRFSHRTDKVTVFGEALFGGGHVSGSNSFVGSGSLNGFAMAFGGGVDVNVGKHVAVRPVKFDYVYNRFSVSGVSESFNNFRYAGGVVFKF
jgi:opacity protein-like surface antigen